MSLHRKVAGVMFVASVGAGLVSLSMTKKMQAQKQGSLELRTPSPNEVAKARGYGQQIDQLMSELANKSTGKFEGLLDPLIIGPISTPPAPSLTAMTGATVCMHTCEMLPPTKPPQLTFPCAGMCHDSQFCAILTQADKIRDAGTAAEKFSGPITAEDQMK